jgi:uncharacterized protein YjbJ (UPF0337 family)
MNRRYSNHRATEIGTRTAIAPASGCECPPGISNHPKKENAMNWDQIEGQWRQAKAKLRQKWGKLTDDDLDVIGGKKDALIGRLQERYGMKKDEAERDVDSFINTI